MQMCIRDSISTLLRNVGCYYFRPDYLTYQADTLMVPNGHVQMRLICLLYTSLQLDELLDALRTATFDVLLTDVQMPAINGVELLKLLRASNIPQAQSVPVIAVTARSDMQREEFTVHGLSLIHISFRGWPGPERNWQRARCLHGGL